MSQITLLANSHVAGLPLMQWLFGLCATLVAVSSIAWLLRLGKLREKYAALWLIIGGVMLGLSVFPPLLAWLAASLSIETPTNLLFFGALVMQLGVLIHLSCECSTLEEETRVLSESAALLKHDVAALKREMDQLRGTGEQHSAPPPQ